MIYETIRMPEELGKLKSLKILMITLFVVLFAGDCAFADVFVSEKGGFSIDLPDGWRQMPKEQFDSIATEGLYLMAINEEAAQAGKNFGIIGMKNQIDPNGPQNLKDITDEQVKVMKSDPSFKGDIKPEFKNIGGVEWSRLAYVLESDGNTIAVVQYTGIIDGLGCTFSFMADDLAVYESVFDKSMASFKSNR